MDWFPLVSIYMPTKNRLFLLKKAIDSVFNQDYKNIELHVVDDGSTDGTYDFLKELSDEKDNVFIYRNDKSIGACAARNLAINNANGMFITGLDDDDVFLPKRISSLVKAYDEKYAFVCSSMFWDYGKKQCLIDSIPMEITLDKQLSYNEATTQVLMKKDRFIEVGGFDETFVACQDYDLWTRLIIQFGNAYRIAVPTYVINDTGSSERMIGNPNSVKGYDQYLAKFSHYMSDKNKKNQFFMRVRRERIVMTLSMLINQIGTGHFKSKLKYYLSSNFSFIRYLHKKSRKI